eukprot:XP_001705754.1 Hypothetical protein GL50803_25710 [Giardia lamblia ATCC 50803]
MTTMSIPRAEPTLIPPTRIQRSTMTRRRTSTRRRY